MFAIRFSCLKQAVHVGVYRPFSEQGDVLARYAYEICLHRSHAIKVPKEPPLLTAMRLAI